MDISEFSRLKNQKEYQRHPWETSRKNVLHTFLKQARIQFPIDRIVDIGSGDAYVIHSLVEKGFAKEYIAIDTAYTPEVIKQLQENNKSEVIYLQNLETYQNKFSENNFTLFLCMDVLEHLEDEKIILDLLSNKTDNYYFFAVPAFQSVFSSHDVLLGHYRRYTLKQLNNLLVNHKFKIILSKANSNHNIADLISLRQSVGIHPQLVILRYLIIGRPTGNTGRITYILL
jgi:hypothetical protein